MESIKSASSSLSTFIEEVHARRILQELWRECKSEEFCDVVLIAGTEEKRIPAHSNILTAASKYFKRLLSPYISKGTAKEVKISNVDSDVLQSLVKYCYTGRVAITEDIVVKLLENANEPLLSDILPTCENLLVEQLLPSNCLGFKLLAEQCGCETLLQKAREYCLEHFMEVQETAEFLRLNAKQLSELLSADNLNVSSEECVFNSVLKWIRHDTSQREKYQAELLKLVRLPLLKKSFLKDHVRPICTSTGCREIYIEAIEESLYAVNPNGRKSVTPRKSNQLLMGITVCNSKSFIYYHCPEQLKWMKWSKDLEYREYPGLAIVEDNLFLVGGHRSYNALNTVVCLNLKTMKLKEVSQMTEYRNWCGVAVLHGFLYAVGGKNRDGNRLNSVEKWNPKTNTWSKVAYMAVGRNSFGIAVLNEKLFVVGGCTSNDRVINLAECYDALENVWTPIASMHDARFHFGVAVSNGLLYAVGGDGGIKTVERYDPETNCWTMLRNLNETMVNLESCTSFRGKVIVCYKDRVEEYDEENNEWKSSAFLKGLENTQRIFTYSDVLLTTEFVEH